MIQPPEYGRFDPVTAAEIIAVGEPVAKPAFQVGFFI